MRVHVKIVFDKEKVGFFTVMPSGSIDSDTYLDFREKIAPILNASTKGIVMDLSGVDYISSAGLGILFAVKKQLKQQNGDLVFCNLKPQIKRLFEIVNALPKETMFKNNVEADAYFYRMMNQTLEKNHEEKEL